jgi:hypothetical protein
MALGRYDLSLLTLPVGWDATALENERLVDGTTYAEVAQMVNTAIASLNAELRGDQTWSLLVSYTDEARLRVQRWRIKRVLRFIPSTVCPTRAAPK